MVQAHTAPPVRPRAVERLEELYDELVTGRTTIEALPEPVRALVLLGWNLGADAVREAMGAAIARAEADADRYYAVAWHGAKLPAAQRRAMLAADEADWAARMREIGAEVSR